MSDKIRVVCGKCQKAILCPPSAAGRKLRCPGCETAIRVPDAASATPTGQAPAPKKARSPGPDGERKRSTRPAGKKKDEFGDSLFDDLTNADYEGEPADSDGLPPRASKNRRSDSRGTASGVDGTKPGAKSLKLGSVIFFSSIVATTLLMNLMPPNMSTAEGKGRAFGQGLAGVMGLIAGIFLMVRGFLANRRG